MNDSLQIDRYVLTTLMRDLVGHDHRPSAFLVYLALLDLAASGGPPLSHAQLAEQTGLSKRAVQDAVRHLVRRGLASIRRGSRTEPAFLQPLFPWCDRRQ